MNADSRSSIDSLVSAAEIARLAGVTRAAVSNWRRRHADFPSPVSGGARNALFALPEVHTWLDRHRKGDDVSGEVLVWQALRGAYGDDMTRGLADVSDCSPPDPPSPWTAESGRWWRTWPPRAHRPKSSPDSRNASSTRRAGRARSRCRPLA
ncbi:hypothetical protein [Streptosporangium sp. NPDC006007]|uniref:helix-turn-helix transcriptional regulator n=1 Tax=Streptosporangium sp. NPDC006007 TaxID=3154575 RepID=UPI0033BD0BB7